MLDNRLVNADRLPTLTEVLDFGPAAAEAPRPDGLPEPSSAAEPLPVLGEVLEFPPAIAALPVLDALPQVIPTPAASPSGVEVGGAVDVERIVSLVMARLEPHIADLLQARLAEALAPALAQVADQLIRDSRTQVSATLRELVQESLAQVLRDSSQASA